MLKWMFTGTCEYCGKEEDILSSPHKECHRLFNKERDEIHDMIIEYFEDHQEYDIHSKITAILNNSNIHQSIKNKFSIKVWKHIVNVALKDLIITEREDKELELIITALNINPDDNRYRKGLKKIHQSRILRVISEGKLPNGSSENTSPFLLQKGEIIIYLRNNVQLKRKEKNIQYEGALFLSRKKRHVTEKYALIDTGYFGVTNKFVYFKGLDKAIKIKLNLIVSTTANPDGIFPPSILIQKSELSNAYKFTIEDGLFVHKLINSLNRF